MRTLYPAFAAVAAALLSGGPALAAGEDLPGDPAAGREFAEGLCAECHPITGRDPFPTEGGPPAFQDVADDPAVTELALRAFLQTPHANMPNIVLPPEQLDDVIAYILSLKGEP